MGLIDVAIRQAELNKKKYSNPHRKYTDTIFIAIQENDIITCLKNPIVLENAQQCILAHRRSELAETNYYDWFDIEYIDEHGEPFEKCLDKNFSLCVEHDGSYRNQMLRLKSSDGIRYGWLPLWNNTASVKDCFQAMWNLYNELRKIESSKERSVIVELYKKDEKILQQKKEIANFSYANSLLERERDMYKGLLDDIKDLLHK